MKVNENRTAHTESIHSDLFDMANNNPKLSRRQEKVANLLSTGKYSAADISIILHYSDPRSYIRELRDKGLNVLDEWVENNDCRYKRYWINVKPEPIHTQNKPSTSSENKSTQSNFLNIFERRHNYD